MHARDLLVDNHAHIPALSALGRLSRDDADHRIAAAPHSIAEIVSHLTFWQEWFCSRCGGSADPPLASAALGWPAPAPGTSDAVRARFAAGLERATAIGNGDTVRPISPPSEHPPLAGYTVRDAIEHMAATTRTISARSCCCARCWARGRRHRAATLGSGRETFLVWATDIAEAFSDFKLIPIWGSDSTDRITDHYDLWSY
jgi:DinB superfamily